MTLDQKDKIEIFENAISWIVVMGMFIYGAAKVAQFSGTAGEDKMVSELSGMELMWVFYGYSQPFVIIIGALEITGGILLLIKKTRVLGCLFLSTILVNIILQDIFYGVHLGALKAALLYQSIILVILWLNREKVIRSLKILLEYEQIDSTRKKFFIKLLIAFVLFVGLRILEYFVTIKW